MMLTDLARWFDWLTNLSLLKFEYNDVDPAKADWEVFLDIDILK